MSDDIAVDAAEKKTAKQVVSAGPKNPFAGIAQGRALVLVPEDLIERRRVMDALEDVLTSSGKAQPRVCMSINLKKLDDSFVIFTAVAARSRSGESKLKVSDPTPCGKHTTEAPSEGIGEEIDFGAAIEPVKILNLPAIVKSLQVNIGPNWRVAFRDGGIRLLNT